MYSYINVFTPLSTRVSFYHPFNTHYMAYVLRTLSCKPRTFRVRVRKVINKKLRGGSAKWNVVKWSKLWLNAGKDSWHYVVHYCYCLVYSGLIFINTNLYYCSCDCCIFILSRVFIVYVVLFAVFRLIFVLFCVMCVICVLCLIVARLPPGRNPFAVKIHK
jgi:hypothetical protein